MNVLQQLLACGHRLAQPSEDQVILAEGNLSHRLDSTQFWVKASGVELATADESGYVTVAFAPILAAFGSKKSDEEVKQCLVDSVGQNARRPSVETFMHAWLLNLPGINAVVHTHPTACLADLCQPEIPRWIEDRIFPDEVVCCGQKSVWVPYTDPGLLLAEAVARQTQIFMEREGHVPRIIALQNHGIIALGSGLSQAESAARMLCKAVRARQISGGSYLPLSKLDVERIARRPDEHYRQQLIWGTELLPSASNEGRTTGQNQQ